MSMQEHTPHPAMRINWRAPHVHCERAPTGGTQAHSRHDVPRSASHTRHCHRSPVAHCGFVSTRCQPDCVSGLHLQATCPQRKPAECQFEWQGTSWEPLPWGMQVCRHAGALRTLCAMQVATLRDWEFMDIAMEARPPNLWMGVAIETLLPSPLT